MSCVNKPFGQERFARAGARARSTNLLCAHTPCWIYLTFNSMTCRIACSACFCCTANKSMYCRGRASSSLREQIPNGWRVLAHQAMGRGGGCERAGRKSWESQIAKTELKSARGILRPPGAFTAVALACRESTSCLCHPRTALPPTHAIITAPATGSKITSARPSSGATASIPTHFRNAAVFLAAA